MIKKVRLKFIIIMMSILLSVLLAIGGTIIISATVSNNNQAKTILEKTADANLEFYQTAQPWLQPTINRLDYARTFCVRLNEQGTPVDGVLDGQFFTTNEIIAIASEIMQLGKTEGNHGDYKFLIKTDIVSVLAVTDRSIENEYVMRTFYTVLLAGAGGLAVLAVIVWLMSYRIVKPIEKTYLLQKQFISDASHELKTPLTTISANASVLMAEAGESKWLSAIQSQTERMNVLINEMLALTKAEEGTKELANFNLSNIVAQCASSFESVAYEQGKELTEEIQPDIMIKSDESGVRKILGIILDNAVKYSEESGRICVTLKKTDNDIVLDVFNSGSFISEEEQAKIFNRFYRSDASRDRKSGGYGLGLAIASAVAENLNIKIKVKSAQNQGTTFSLHFS